MKLQTEINKTWACLNQTDTKLSSKNPSKQPQKALKTVVFVPSAQWGGRSALLAFTCGTSPSLGCATTQGLLPGTSGKNNNKKKLKMDPKPHPGTAGLSQHLLEVIAALAQIPWASPSGPWAGWAVHPHRLGHLPSCLKLILNRFWLVFFFVFFVNIDWGVSWGANSEC